MTRGTVTTRTLAAGVRAMFDPDAVAHVLRAHVPLEWPKVGDPRAVRIERYWPVGRTQLALEWSFRLAAGGRCSLSAVPDNAVERAPAPKPDPSERANVVRITGEGLRALHVDVPEHGLTLHSPDCDPAMPHLAACLDSEIAARHLGVCNGRHETHRATAAGRVEPRLLGYRARRRAAIRYDVCPRDGTRRTMVGKTFHDDRGTRLLDAHTRLHERVLQGSGGRVHIPMPLGHDRALRMALFAWSPGEKLDDDSASTNACVRAAADALACLHRVDLEDDATRFTVEDECRVIRRWHHVLQMIDPGKAEATASLVDRLLAWAGTIPAADVCTIHRDFYERQLVAAPTRVTILDLDTISVGDPCVDLGNFLAHLLLRVRRQSDATGGFAKPAALFIRRYEKHVGDVDRKALGFYVCSALFRLGAVHAFRSATGRFAEGLWELATRQLAQESFRVAQWNSHRTDGAVRRPVPVQ